MNTTLAPMRHYRTLVFDSARWSDIELRAGDIVVSTPPKSGTTWTQMLCALLIFDGPDFPAPLEQLSPWVDMLDRPIDEVRATLAAQRHRRVVKTHTPLDGLPDRDDIHYVVVGRDPRDIAVSFDHHMANLDLDRFLDLRRDVVGPEEAMVEPPPPPPADPADRYRYFVDGDTDPAVPTLAMVLHHLKVAWQRRHRPNVHLLHYADLRRDLPAELLRLGRDLGFAITPERACELAAEATIDRMRERSDEVAPSASLGLWRDTSRFIRNGGTGEWRVFTGPEDDAHYGERVASLIDIDLARWVHGGSR